MKNNSVLFATRFPGKVDSEVIKGVHKGFTLVELLVVVLIIGILASIALPQYQRAVRKTRFASLKPVAKTVKNAQEIFYLTNGHYAEGTAQHKLDSSLLDIVTSVSFPMDAEVSDTSSHQYVRVKHDKLPNNRYRMYFNHSENFANNVYCEALSTDNNAKALCVAEGGVEGPTDGDYTLYLLEGNSTGAFQTHTPIQFSFASNDHGDLTFSDGTNTMNVNLFMDYYRHIYLNGEELGYYYQYPVPADHWVQPAELDAHPMQELCQDYILPGFCE